MKFMYSILISCFLFIGQAYAVSFNLLDATSFSPEKVQVQAQSIGVPVGTVIVWTKNAVPDGWLECNGQAVNKTLYPELAALMSTTPNYQGMFLRGAGSQWKNYNGYGWTEHGTTLGQVQGDSVRSFSGQINIGVGSDSSGNISYTTSHGAHVFGNVVWVDRPAFVINLANSMPVSNEIRPVNVGVKYLIKAK